MSLDTILKRLSQSPESIEFDEIIALIDALYDFTPTAFRNGEQVNAAGENNGSCKILAFGRLHDLPPEQLLACFGHHYRDSVLQNPNGSDHQNIRNFQVHGWAGVELDGEPLKEK